MQQLGVRDLLLRTATLRPRFSPVCQDGEVDVLYGIGGAPEGVVFCAVIRALDGDMNGRMLARHDVKGDNEEKHRVRRAGAGTLQSDGRRRPVKYRLGDRARGGNHLSATVLPKAIAGRH
ncbi:fructose-bisphosphatase class II [Shigella flexneri]